ncbi:hypothetical protein [Roseimicrobium gellanilyticum]|uniref:hypothetical protein n=1 Tax=Roseimicrobium gellanilyticum TaxID=748857 RepID=UPI00147623D9|nr:hypothetical protein [Roseimicrobium gellanilyticum]
MSLATSWKRISTHLEEARRHLPAQPLSGEEGGRIESYTEFLDHNELELALDELEMLASANTVTESFWTSMHAAACEMGLSLRAERYKAKTGTYSSPEHS